MPTLKDWLGCVSWVRATLSEQWMRNLGTFAWVRPDPLYDFHNPISPFLLKFLLQALWFRVSFCLIFFPPLCGCCILPPHRNDLCDGFLLHLTRCFWQNREYMAQSQLSLKSYDVSSVKKRFRLIQCLYMTIYVRVGVMTGHCPSHRVPQFSADALYWGGDTRRDAAGR